MSTVDTFNDNNIAAEAEKEKSQDVIIELFWYIKRKRKTAFDDHLIFEGIILSLECEGIYFWRDKRYLESHKVALGWIDQDHNRQQQSPTPIVSTEIHEEIGALPVSYAKFMDLVKPCARLFLSAFNEENIIPDWTRFTTDLKQFYENSKEEVSGITAQYIPLLRDAIPNRWGVSVCSTSGQRFSIGDTRVPFSLQSVSKPVTYALAMAREGEDFMEEWIDVEPAGRPFNTQDLDPVTQRPFNASVNSGAIMAAGVLASGYESEKNISWRDIVDDIRDKWTELCGHDMEAGFSNETYESEKATAYNNFAIAYNLKGRKGLPRDVDLQQMLDVYLGCCSIEMTTEALSVAAATLANGGICPITEKEVFPANVVRSVLAETMTCGMYDGAGRFMVEVGLPAKSGVSGVLMVMVPGLFGFATFSPRLNKKGNSARGIDFCKRLVQCYRLHMFEPLAGNNGGKIDPRQNGWKDEQKEISNLAWAASVGDDEATKLRDIFLAAVCRIAESSSKGLALNKENVIKEKYKQHFGVELDQKLFEEISKHVREHPEDYKYLERLSHKAYMTDAMKEVIFNAMVEIAMSDGIIDKNERRVAIRIAEGSLGINKAVANLQIDRYEKQVGHRFDTVNSTSDIYETCHHGSILDHGPSILGSIDFKDYNLYDDDDDNDDDDDTNVPFVREEIPSLPSQRGREEAALLRKKIRKLGKKLAAIVHHHKAPPE